MCGRYSFAPSPKQLHEDLPGVALPAQLEISFNIAPTQNAYVVTSDAPGHLQKLEWGLVPYWSHDGKNSGKMINARSEGIGDKPSFRVPLRERRCLVPADSFYEWKTVSGKKKPYRILRKDGSLLLMAGIWDEWRHDGLLKKTFSIITTTPNTELSELHDRMPVIFPDNETAQAWLADMPLEQTLKMLHPPADGLLTMYRVSDRLNRAGVDGADLQDQVDEELRLF